MCVNEVAVWPLPARQDVQKKLERIFNLVYIIDAYYKVAILKSLKIMKVPP